MLIIVNLFVLATLIIVNLFVLVTLFVVSPLVLVMFAKVNKLLKMLILIKLCFLLMSVNPIVKKNSMILPAECCIYYLKFLLLLFSLAIFLVSMVSSTFHVSILNLNIMFLVSTKFIKCKYIFETLFKILSKVFYRHLYIYLITINFLNFCLLFDIAHSIKPKFFFVVVVKFHKHIKN